MTKETHARMIPHMDGRTGRTAYAVWVGYRFDRNDPRRLIGARLLNIYTSKSMAERVAAHYITRPDSTS